MMDELSFYVDENGDDWKAADPADFDGMYLDEAECLTKGCHGYDRDPAGYCNLCGFGDECLTCGDAGVVVTAHGYEPCEDC